MSRWIDKAYRLNSPDATTSNKTMTKDEAWTEASRLAEAEGDRRYLFLQVCLVVEPTSEQLQDELVKRAEAIAEIERCLERGGWDTSHNLALSMI